MTIVSVYVVFRDREEAERTGRAVIEERLAACINILGPCHSIYRWKGKVESADEVPAIFKTSADEVDALIARVAELHSYEVPCTTALRVDGIFEPYADWITDELKRKP